MQTIILGICACLGAFALGWCARNGKVEQLEARIEAGGDVISDIYDSLPERRLNKSEVVRLRQRVFDLSVICKQWLYETVPRDDVPEEGANCPTQPSEIDRLACPTQLSEIDRLADYILKRWPHEIKPTETGGGESAVDISIRLLDRHADRNGDQPERVEPLVVEPGGSKEGTRQSCPRSRTW